MTILIKKQLLTIAIMCLGGTAAGLINDVFRLFEKRFFRNSKIIRGVIVVAEAIVIAYLFGEYSFLCQNGKITFIGIVSFFVGLLLWHKYFCDIISIGEENEQKREEAPRV